MKIKLILSVVLLCLCFRPTEILAEIKPTKELVLQVSRTYGYYLGQQYTLDYISDKYPSLSINVLLAQKEFSYSFSNSLENMNKFMIDLFGFKWKNIRKNMQDAMYKTLKVEISSMDKSKAIRFVDEVKNRAKGDIESPVFETLLLFKKGYESKPEQEFIDGYRYTYKNDGSGKAKGVKFSLQLPRTWEAMEGNRPNVVKKFVNYQGSTLMVIIKDIPLEENEKVDKYVIDEMLKKNNIGTILPSQSVYEKSGKITLEGLPGLWVQYSVELNRMRTTMKIESIMYIIVYKNKMIQIHGTNVVSVNGKNIENGGILKYEKLFDMVVNTLVLPEIYN